MAWIIEDSARRKLPGEPEVDWPPSGRTLPRHGRSLRNCYEFSTREIENREMNDPAERDDAELDALLQRTRTNGIARLEQILDTDAGISSIIAGSPPRKAAAASR
jgi:hypothetical protein